VVLLRCVQIVTAIALPDARGLQEILAFTICTPDLATSQRAYETWLGYRLLESASVTREEAQTWRTPAIIGHRYSLLAPPACSRTLIRLVEQAAQPSFTCMKHYGWNAIEILVQNPYELARQLTGSPFRIAVPPRPLPFDVSIHAMQVWGPADELIYFTSLPTHKTILDLSGARTQVDRPFIAILGGAAAADMLDYYRIRLHTRVIAPQPVVVRIINETFALPQEHTISMGIVKLPKDYLIEVDEVPATARERPVADGLLPPGIAMLTFAVADFGVFDVEWHAEPRALASQPYAGDRVGVTRGAAREWIELVERKPRREPLHARAIA
jgi:hypothetical protein